MAARTKAGENGTSTALGESQSNDAAVLIEATAPYVATIEIEGTSAILFHRWSNEDVAAKAAASKGSKTKKSDNVESYVYRDAKEYIGIPGEYLRMAIVNAGRYRQDPRSPRKSAMDLFKAAIVPLTDVAPIQTKSEKATKFTPTKTWDYLDERRVLVQRNAITRVRPAFLAGWRCTFDLLINLPTYVPPAMLLDTINDAGRFVGLADFRPTFGRFSVVKFDIGFDS